jgi:hypothetical protein
VGPPGLRGRARQCVPVREPLNRFRPLSEGEGRSWRPALGPARSAQKHRKPPCDSAPLAVSPHVHALVRGCPALSCRDSWCPWGGAAPLVEKQSWLKTDSGNGLLRSTGLAPRSVTTVVMGTYSVRPGWRTAARNLVPDPSVLAIDDRAPSSRGGGGENQRRGKTPDFATPRHAQAFDRPQCGVSLASARV